MSQPEELNQGPVREELNQGLVRAHPVQQLRSRAGGRPGLPEGSTCSVALCMVNSLGLTMREGWTVTSQDFGTVRLGKGVSCFLLCTPLNQTC